MDKLLNTNEVAAILGVSTRTVKRLIARRSIPCIRDRPLSTLRSFDSGHETSILSLTTTVTVSCTTRTVVESAALRPSAFHSLPALSIVGR
jgi:excisionase family DNA binding protein